MATSDVTLSDSVEGATATPHHNIQGQYHGLEPQVRADNSDIAVTTTTSNINEEQHLLVSRENQKVNSALSKICYGRRGIQNQPSTVSNVGIPMAASPSNVVQPAVVVTSQYSTTVGSAQPVYGNVPDFRATVSTQQVTGNDSRPTAPTVIGEVRYNATQPPEPSVTVPDRTAQWVYTPQASTTGQSSGPQQPPLLLPPPMASRRRDSLSSSSSSVSLPDPTHYDQSDHPHQYRPPASNHTAGSRVSTHSRRSGTATPGPDVVDIANRLVDGLTALLHLTNSAKPITNNAQMHYTVSRPISNAYSNRWKWYVAMQMNVQICRHSRLKWYAAMQMNVLTCRHS